MQGKIKMLLAAAIALPGIAVYNANGGCVYDWNGSVSSDWKVAANWTVGSGFCLGATYPINNGDKAVIRQAGSYDPSLDLAGANLTIGQLLVEDDGDLEIEDTTASAYALILDADGSRNGTLVMESGGIIDIEAGGAIKFEDAVTHTIAGDINVVTATSEIVIAEDVVFDEYNSTKGFVIGKDNAAVFTIVEPSSGDNQFTNRITLSGKLTVQILDGAGTATFNNEGTVAADADGGGSDAILDFAANVLLAGSGQWVADTDPDAVLRFNQAASGLTGEFQLEADATLKFLADITTSGCFEDDPRCGTVNASASGVCFTANGCDGYTQCGSQSYSVSCP